MRMILKVLEALGLLLLSTSVGERKKEERKEDYTSLQPPALAAFLLSGVTFRPRGSLAPVRPYPYQRSHNRPSAAENGAQ